MRGVVLPLFGDGAAPSGANNTRFNMEITIINNMILFLVTISVVYLLAKGHANHK